MKFNELNMKMNNTQCAVALEFALMLNAIYFAFIYFFPLIAAGFSFFIIQNPLQKLSGDRLEVFN